MPLHLGVETTAGCGELRTLSAQRPQEPVYCSHSLTAGGWRRAEPAGESTEFLAKQRSRRRERPSGAPAAVVNGGGRRGRQVPRQQLRNCVKQWVVGPPNFQPLGSGGGLSPTCRPQAPAHRTTRHAHLTSTAWWGPNRRLFWADWEVVIARPRLGPQRVVPRCATFDGSGDQRGGTEVSRTNSCEALPHHSQRRPIQSRPSGPWPQPPLPDGLCRQLSSRLAAQRPTAVGPPGKTHARIRRLTATKSRREAVSRRPADTPPGGQPQTTHRAVQQSPHQRWRPSRAWTLRTHFFIATRAVCWSGTLKKN